MFRDYMSVNREEGAEFNCIDQTKRKGGID